MVVNSKFLHRCIDTQMFFFHGFYNHSLELRRISFVWYSFWHSKTPHLLDSISYCLTNGVQFNFLPQGDFLLTGIPRGNGPMESDCARSNAANAPWHPRFSGSCAVLSGSAAALCRADRAAPPYCTLSGKQHPASAGKHMLSAALHPSKSPLDWKNEGADEPPLRGV